jgi:hypothetical protein
MSRVAPTSVAKPICIRKIRCATTHKSVHPAALAL